MVLDHNDHGITSRKSYVDANSTQILPTSNCAGVEHLPVTFLGEMIRSQLLTVRSNDLIRLAHHLFPILLFFPVVVHRINDIQLTVLMVMNVPP